MALYDLKTNEVIKFIVDDLKPLYPNMSKSEIKCYVLNALMSNIVQSEIKEQIDFLIENDGYL